MSDVFTSAALNQKHNLKRRKTYQTHLYWAELLTETTEPPLAPLSWTQAPLKTLRETHSEEMIQRTSTVFERLHTVSNFI